MCPQLFSQIYAAQLFFNRRLSFAGKKGLSAGAGFGVFSIFPAVGKTEDKEDAKNCHCQIYRQITNDSNTDRSNSNCIYKKYLSVVFSARVSPDDCSPSKRRRRATLLPPFYFFLPFFTRRVWQSVCGDVDAAAEAEARFRLRENGVRTSTSLRERGGSSQGCDAAGDSSPLSPRFLFREMRYHHRFRK